MPLLPSLSRLRIRMNFNPRITRLLPITCLVVLAASSAALGDEGVDRALAAVRNVGREGQGFAEAIPAAGQLRRLPATEIPRLLDAAADTNPIAENWFRGVIFDVARSGGDSSPETLRAYVVDRSNNPTGRGLAMELIRKQDRETADALIATCLDDPSLPLREMAVEQAIGHAEELAKAGDSTAAIMRYRSALTAARHPKQLARVVEALGKLGDQVATAEAFALITEWKAVAPFDNEGGVGFDSVYPPEAQFVTHGTVDLNAKYDGKRGPVHWQPLPSTGPEGTVDLAAPFNQEKGAVAYLYTEFESPQAREVEVRLGCINANKVWINGKELMATEVYHAGTMIDQYIAPTELVAGTNRILLKICQNEQTESWAQRWEFQFRLTDPSGKGLRSSE